MQYRVSDGKLMKWFINGTFIKTSSINNNDIKPRFMYESYSEVIASELCKDLGIRSINYKPCKLIIDDCNITVGCYCDSFLSKDEVYLSIGSLMDRGLVQLPIGVTAYDKLKKTINNKGFSETLDNCILLDYVILNCDRHYGNFGIVRSNKGKIRSAPVFDSGDSLFGSKFIEDVTYSNEMAEYVTARPFSHDFDIQLSLVNKRLTYTTLKNTRDSVVCLVKDWGLPKGRAEFLYDLIKSRVKKVIK